MADMADAKKDKGIQKRPEQDNASSLVLKSKSFGGVQLEELSQETCFSSLNTSADSRVAG